MSTTSMPEAPANLAGSMSTFRLQDKVVLLLLTLRAPGNERTVRDKSILKTNANLASLHVGKRLLECPEYRAISILDGQMRDFVARIALPTPFKAGTHVIALDLLEMVDQRLTDFAEQRRELVQAFAAVYGSAKQKAKDTLGELYREEEYLNLDQLDAAYRMTWQYVTLTAPDKMETMNNEIFRREQKRLQAQWDNAIGDMRDALRVGLAELVDDMVKRLSDDKKFKPTKLLGRFEEFLETFDARNVTNDAELKELADKARALLAGVDTESLKKSPELREQVRAGFRDAAATLQTIEIGARAQRRITFEDE